MSEEAVAPRYCPSELTKHRAANICRNRYDLKALGRDDLKGCEIRGKDKLKASEQMLPKPLHRQMKEGQEPRKGGRETTDDSIDLWDHQEINRLKPRREAPQEERGRAVIRKQGAERERSEGGKDARTPLRSTHVNEMVRWNLCLNPWNMAKDFGGK